MIMDSSCSSKNISRSRSRKKASNKTILKPESKFKYQKNEQLVKLFVFLLEPVYVCVDFLYVFVVFENAVKFFKGFKVIA